MNQLQSLNAQVAVEGQQPRAVAAKYLQQSGLVR
jgi:glycine betaine/choline ABC-type transport system substrate-binding protein